MKFIEIWEPRYRDRTVLIAPRHLPKSGPAYVKVTKGSFKGNYEIAEEDWKAGRSDVIRAKNGSTFNVVAVSLDKLKVMEEE